MTENELYHYGVKGMKWGVRRYEKSGGSYTKAGVKRFNESANTYDTAKSLYKILKKNKKEKGNSFDVDVESSDRGKATIKVKDANQSIKTAKQMMKESKSKRKTTSILDRINWLTKVKTYIQEDIESQTTLEQKFLV